MKLKYVIGILSLSAAVSMGIMTTSANVISNSSTKAETTESTASSEVLQKGVKTKVITTKKNVVEAGWRNDGRWWYQNSDGSYPKAEWQMVNGLWYYFDATGYMEASKWIANKYYVSETGAMLTNTTTPDGYRVGADGAWINDATGKPTPSHQKLTSRINVYELEGGKHEMYLYGMDISYAVGSTEDRSELKVYDSYYTVSNVYFLNYNRSTSSYTKSAGPATIYINKDAEVVTADGSRTTASAYYEANGRLSIDGDVLKTSALGFDKDGYVKLLDLR